MEAWRTLSVTLPVAGLALYALWSSWGMPASDPWATSAALFPMICAGLLLGLTLVQSVSVARRLQSRGDPRASGRPHRQGERPLAFTLMLLFAAYPGLLLRLLPFDLATLAFLLLVIGLVLEGGLKPRIAGALLALSLSLPLLFEPALGLPLPGKRALVLHVLDRLVVGACP